MSKERAVIIFTTTYESASFGRFFLKGCEYTLHNAIAHWFVRQGYAKYSERWCENDLLKRGLKNEIY